MKNLLTLAAIALPFLLDAQKWEIGASLFGTNYQGDLVQPVVPAAKETNIGGGLFLRHHFNDRFALRGGFNVGKINGDDANFTDRASRGYKFSSPISEVHLLGDLTLLKPLNKEGAKRKMLPYVFAGLGYALTNPETDFGNDQSPNVVQDKKDLEKSTLVVPFGAGLKFPLNDRWTLSAELGSRATLTDYLDGVSKAGDQDDNDWYLFGGFTIGYRLGAPPLDTDGDGISDARDACPEVPGTRENKGCPADRDKDGIADNEDRCPDVFGVVENSGCPADRDRDGVYDTADSCPDQKGPATNRGCPNDRDSDGVADNEDKCPDLAGDAANMGCPSDRDKDGVYDADDSCPDTPGPASNKGCPRDRDNDGIPDDRDNCPDTPGLASNKGCPEAPKPGDRDNDGVVDTADKCPDVAGPATNGGCPEMKAEDKKVIEFAIKNINFEANKATFTRESYQILDQLVDVLKRYDYYNVAIEGHTDSDGSTASNLTLSKNRAKACFDYLIKNGGIRASRLTHEGYGESRPIAPNTTPENKRLNRRVEFNLNVN